MRVHDGGGDAGCVSHCWPRRWYRRLQAPSASSSSAGTCSLFTLMPPSRTLSSLSSFWNILEFSKHKKSEEICWTRTLDPPLVSTRLNALSYMDIISRAGGEGCSEMLTTLLSNICVSLLINSCTSSMILYLYLYY